MDTILKLILLFRENKAGSTLFAPVKLFANSGDPDQMQHSAAFDLGLHCLPSTCLGISRLQWVKPSDYYEFQVEQLAEETGEESILLTASVTDGSLSHLGSESGKDFLDNHDDIKSQFLGFCLTSKCFNS